MPDQPAESDEVREVYVSGRDDVYVLRADGTVVCHGRYREEGGHPFQTLVSRRFVIPLPEPARHVAARSEARACAVLRSGRVLCWTTAEDRPDGQFISFGPGSPREVSLPMPAELVEVGGDTACALTGTGGVYCWGLLWSSGEARDVTSPTRITGLPSLETVSVSGTGAACGTDARGVVWCSGPETVIHRVPSDHRSRRRGDVLDVAEVRLGGWSCARLRCGRVHCWGSAPDLKTVEPILAIDGGQSYVSPVCVLSARGVRCFDFPRSWRDERPLAALVGRWTPLPAR